MRQQPDFADTVIDHLMGLPERAPAGVPHQHRFDRRTVALRSMPRVVPTARALVPRAAPSQVQATAPTSAGQMLAIGLMALVLMPAASLSMLMVLQAGLF